MGKRADDVAVIDWCGYEGNAALFPVCMKSPAVNGRSLKAQLSVARQRIERLTLVICDSLDRHNVSHIANATEHCMHQADAWLDFNLPVVREYFPSAEVIRWEYDIRRHPAFESRLETVKGLYDRSEAYRNLRDSMSLYYLHSKQRRFEQQWLRGEALRFDKEAALKGSADYLDEEFAGDMIYYEMTGGQPHIYWGLYVDDHDIFSRESGTSLPFPQTLPVRSQRHGPSIKASMLSPEGNIRSSVFSAT